MSEHQLSTALAERETHCIEIGIETEFPSVRLIATLVSTITLRKYNVVHTVIYLTLGGVWL